MTTLRQAVQEYLSMRQALGFKLREAGKGLLDFVTFMEQRRATYITSALALAWAQQPRNVQHAHWARRLSYVRVFARHRSATDPRTQIPPPGLLPFQPNRARPYIYSNDEIERLLQAALKMRCRYERGQLRPWVYYCLFGLLSVSGVRLSEARNLELQDVDLNEGMLTIRGAKFGKTRVWCRCMLRPVRSSVATSSDAIAIGHVGRSHPLCSSLVGGIDWMAETFVERSMPYPGRSGCAGQPTNGGRACTT